MQVPSLFLYIAQSYTYDVAAKHHLFVDKVLVASTEKIYFSLLEHVDFSFKADAQLLKVIPKSITVNKNRVFLILDILPFLDEFNNSSKYENKF